MRHSANVDMTLDEDQVRPSKKTTAETIQASVSKNQETSTNMEQPGDSALTTSVNHVTVRLPPCWKENISLWFVQAEAQFANSRIKEDFTKYNIIIAALDSTTLQCVSDIVTNPPTSDKYANLKAALIDRLQDSAERRLTRLLTGIQLEDRKPTGLLRHMLELAGPSLAESAIVRTLWLQRLPQHVQAILSALPDNDINQLATAADKILDVYQSTDCSAVEHRSKPSSSHQEPVEQSLLLQLQKQITALSREVSQLRIAKNEQKPNHSGRRNQSPHRGSNRARSGSRNRSPNRNPDGKCFYHAKFGDNAYKCKRPCTHGKKAAGNANGISQ